MENKKMPDLKAYRSRARELREDFDTYRRVALDIRDYMLPQKGKYLSSTEDSKSKRGARNDEKIINGTATDAIGVLAAGLQSGLTSPSRPWFALGVADKEKMKYAPVREWLFGVRDAMLSVFSRSNFYGSTHGLYSELGTFGTAAMMIEEDFKTVIRCRPFTIGEYHIALDNRYRPDSLYRQCAISAYNLVERFGKDNVSDAVRRAVEVNKGDTRFEIQHCIQPNSVFQLGKDGVSGKAFESVYYEIGRSSEEGLLRRGGYETIPFVAPRWNVSGADTYGTGQGYVSLGDVKMLQKMEDKKLKKIDKNVDPPMNADPELKKKGGSIISGAVNYVAQQKQGAGFYPAYHPDANIQSVAIEIANVENRIRRFFFNDLFLAIIQQSKQMTATEVVERHSEKLLMVGPVIERLQAEMLDIVIERTYNIMQRFGLIAPVPRELEGSELNIEYISSLAQAQKMVGTAAVEQTVGFAGNMFGVYPEARYKIKPLDAIDEYALMVGAPPSIIRDDDEVNELVEADRVAAQRQQAQEQMLVAAQGAETLSKARLGENTALDKLAERMA